MATLEGGITFTGSIGKLSAYRMKGSDKIILRQKGGPSKKQVLTSRKFERTRENMMEFAGVSKTVAAIRRPLIALKRLSDHNFTATLVSICKNIQLEDPAGDRGQRSIFLSQHRYLLAGFRLHLKHPFLNIVTGPVGYTLNRETKSVVVQLPRLVKGINLHLPWKQPLYRFCMSFGLVPDVVYENGAYNDHPEGLADTSLVTAWHVATDPFQSQTVELKLNTPDAIKDSQTLLFTIGIEMGAPGANGGIVEVKHAGAACILAVG
jgi:hypothetical protein